MVVCFMGINAEASISYLVEQILFRRRAGTGGTRCARRRRDRGLRARTSTAASWPTC
jgi:hypothetical protein